MAHPRKSREHDSTNEAVPGGCSDKGASENPIDPRAFGLSKAAYGVGETLDLLSIGRTSLYEAIKRGAMVFVHYACGPDKWQTDFIYFRRAVFLRTIKPKSGADRMPCRLYKPDGFNELWLTVGR
jgi:hypothetical protein